MIEWARWRAESGNRHSERKEGRQEGKEGKRKGKREEGGKTGRQGRKEAAFSCFPTSDSEGYFQLACQPRGWRPWRLVELITYHSQNMCLLRRGVDTPFPPRRVGHFLFMGKAHVRGTWQEPHYRLNEEAATHQSLQSSAEKMGPGYCLRCSQGATRDKPESPVLIHLLCTLRSTSQRLSHITKAN